jgi:hypothetical protein
MANFLRISNGVARSFPESSSSTIYDQSLSVLASGASGPNQINGPIITGTNVTLPASGTYNGAELQIYINGNRAEPIFDYSYVGAGPSRTQVQFTFDLIAGDRIDFRIDRAP